LSSVGLELQAQPHLLSTARYELQQQFSAYIKVDAKTPLILGITENVPLKIQNFFIPVDFVILDMKVDAKTPLIFGRPFLSTANAHIDVGAGEIQLNINGKMEKLAFRPKVEQCSQVRTFNWKKSEKEQ